MQKPDGLTILAKADIETKVWPMPIRKLYGVGPKTEEHIKRIGIETVGQLAALPVEKLVDRGLSRNPISQMPKRRYEKPPLPV